MKLLLIAGHGAGDPGAVATIGTKRYEEASEARVLVSLVAELLNKRFPVSAEVYPSAKNAYQDLRAGALRADRLSGFDCVLEVHFNACASGAADGRRKGTECYVPVGGKTGVASSLCKALESLGFPNRGVKQKDFSVIAAAKRAGAEAALLETCFLDDPDDMALYLSGKNAAAEAITEGLRLALRLNPQKRTSRQIVQESAGLSDATMDYLAAYRWGKDLLDKLAAAMQN